MPKGVSREAEARQEEREDSPRAVRRDRRGEDGDFFMPLFFYVFASGCISTSGQPRSRHVSRTKVRVSSIPIPVLMWTTASAPHRIAMSVEQSESCPPGA